MLNKQKSESLPHDLQNLHTEGENKEIHKLIWFGKNAKCKLVLKVLLIIIKSESKTKERKRLT